MPADEDAGWKPSRLLSASSGQAGQAGATKNPMRRDDLSYDFFA
jgi:hypothetical protein